MDDVRLIDANALRQRIIKDYRKEFFGSVLWNVLDDMPTIDAVSVVHGKWIATSVDPADPYFRCSVCHYGIDEIFNGGEEPFNYCPDCGVRMDGGAADD